MIRPRDAELIEKMGGIVVEAAFIIDLPDLGGRKRLCLGSYLD